MDNYHNDLRDVTTIDLRRPHTETQRSSQRVINNFILTPSTQNPQREIWSTILGSEAMPISQSKPRSMIREDSSFDPHALPANRNVSNMCVHLKRVCLGSILCLLVFVFWFWFLSLSRTSATFNITPNFLTIAPFQGCRWDLNIFPQNYVVTFAHLIGDLSAAAYGRGCPLRAEVCGIVKHTNTSTGNIFGSIWADAYILSDSNTFPLYSRNFEYSSPTARSFYTTNISIVEGFNKRVITLTGLLQMSVDTSKFLGICYQRDDTCLELDQLVSNFFLSHMISAEFLICKEFDFNFVFN